MNLLPCPFCGAANPLFNVAQAQPGQKPGWYIRCRKSDCGARLESATAPGTMKRWNNRPAPAAPVAPSSTDH